MCKSNFNQIFISFFIQTNFFCVSYLCWAQISCVQLFLKRMHMRTHKTKQTKFHHTPNKKKSPGHQLHGEFYIETFSLAHTKQKQTKQITQTNVLFKFHTLFFNFFFLFCFTLCHSTIFSFRFTWYLFRFSFHSL